jgi:hypothetical protein
MFAVLNKRKVLNITERRANFKELYHPSAKVKGTAPWFA